MKPNSKAMKHEYLENPEPGKGYNFKTGWGRVFRGLPFYEKGNWWVTCPMDITYKATTLELGFNYEYFTELNRNHPNNRGVNTHPKHADKKTLDPLGRYLLQCVDCNCNDCIFMERDIEKTKAETSRVGFGRCTWFQKDVSFLPNTCQLKTQDCFIHRRKDKFEN